MSETIIYTGEKGVGKSTYLSVTFLQKPNVCGILQPRFNRIKYLVDIESTEKKRLELDEQPASEKVITIGNYIFSEATFEWGRQKLSEAVLTKNQLLIIDEIGPLELKGLGLEPVLSEVISKAILFKKKLLLVVRPKLVEEVKVKYGLFDSKITQFGEKLQLRISQL